MAATAALAFCLPMAAQTESDAIMMGHKLFCTGFAYGQTKWDHYWEGTLKRNNENIGTVTTKSVLWMGSYGLTKDINIIAGLPYVWTEATAGTLKGLKGVQDASLAVKWKALEKHNGATRYRLFAVAGASMPVSDYVADFQPLSIGLQSRTAYLRAMGDYQRGRFFTTALASYHLRSNVTIDRQAYYTTEMHYTDEVRMPDANFVQLRAGYRSPQLVAEVVADKWTTLGGFDIRRNDMPFPSNRMNATRVGLALKYEPSWLANWTFIGNYSETVAGRNMGQGRSLSAGLFYIFNFNPKGTSVNTTNSN